LPNYEARIIEALRRSDRSLSTLELAKNSGLSKSTVIKYLATFRMAGKADFEEIGSSRLWRLLMPAKEKGRSEATRPRKRELYMMLKKFVESTDLTGFALVDLEGYPLSTILPKAVLPGQSEMLASLLSTTGTRIVELAGLEEFQWIIIEGTKGRVFAYKKGGVVLVAFSRPETMIAPIRMEMEELAERIGRILSDQADPEKLKEIAGLPSLGRAGATPVLRD